jgi:hypothetical protein
MTNASSLAFVIALSLAPAIAAAGETSWQRYVIRKSGATVEIPIGLFSEDGGTADSGIGRRFYSGDRRADLTVQSIASQDSPAAFLAKQRPPSDIVYKKVTPDFFVVSSIRNGKIWYDRCNRSGGYMNCVLINYPAAEKRQWDAVVTRISQTLN